VPGCNCEPVNGDCFLPQSLERELKDTRASLQALNSEKKQLLEDADELMARKASLEIAVGELDAKVSDEKTTKVSKLSAMSLVWGLSGVPLVQTS